MIPLRAGAEALLLSFDVEELAAAAPRPNVALERFWAGALTVLRDRWPDWPIEVWATVLGDADDAEDALPPEPDEDDDEPLSAPPPDAPPTSFTLTFAVFFAGEERTDPTVKAMASFVRGAAQRGLPLAAATRWGGIAPGWKALWAVDDGEVLRLFASEATVEDSVYLLGTYAGIPTLFAASVEAWPLHGAAEAIGVRLEDADPEWAFR